MTIVEMVLYNYDTAFQKLWNCKPVVKKPFCLSYCQSLENNFYLEGKEKYLSFSFIKIHFNTLFPNCQYSYWLFEQNSCVKYKSKKFSWKIKISVNELKVRSNTKSVKKNYVVQIQELYEQVWCHERSVISSFPSPW